MSIERSFQPHLTEHASHTHSTMYSKHNVKRNAPLLYAKYVFKFQPFRSMTCSCWLNTQNVKNQSHSTIYAMFHFVFTTKQCFTLFTIKKKMMQKWKQYYHMDSVQVFGSLLMLLLRIMLLLFCDLFIFRLASMYG